MPTIIPVLRVFDYDKIIEFYINWLGCTIVWELHPKETPFYMQISLRGNLINLSQHHGECSPGALVIISDFSGLEAYHQSLLDKHYMFMNPGLNRQEWDDTMLTMRIIIPFIILLSLMNG